MQSVTRAKPISRSTDFFRKYVGISKAAKKVISQMNWHTFFLKKFRTD